MAERPIRDAGRVLTQKQAARVAKQTASTKTSHSVRGMSVTTGKISVDGAIVVRPDRRQEESA